MTGQSGDFNSTETTSSTLNSTATLTFTGTSVQWIGTMGPNNGKASVSIDGGAATTVDTYSSTTKRQQLIYTKTGLTNASHTIKITVLGTHDFSATASLVSIDAINVPGSPALEPFAPNVTVTDTDSTCANNEDYPPTQIPTATQGALERPGEPYGNYSVCADNGTSTTPEHPRPLPTRASWRATPSTSTSPTVTNLASGTCPEDRLTRELRAALRDERGFTLIELLVASLAGIIVATAPARSSSPRCTSARTSATASTRIRRVASRWRRSRRRWARAASRPGHAVGRDAGADRDGRRGRRRQRRQ